MTSDTLTMSDTVKEDLSNISHNYTTITPQQRIGITDPLLWCNFGSVILIGYVYTNNRYRNYITQQLHNNYLKTERV